ncbi:hypothetical protein FZEAL_6712 [Fusarium zealandicum]|uniref:Heterokaryon incompatibility protein n=1 Tax=Fusarium zealandicum TaxID=1053134 RepID=A0A8H4UH86_9HYPO|nr:hypothetical protein FZEAL_6712 [Fusarium zealandicum]
MAQSIIVLCEDRQASLDELVCLTNNIRLARITDQTLALHRISCRVPDHGGSSIPILASLLQKLRKGGELHIVSLLELARRKLATEPVDKTYGVLSLLGESLQKNIKVDYGETAKKEFWRLYIEVGVLLLSEYGPSMLDIGISKTRCQELPSWCPGFRSPASVNPRGQIWLAGLADEDDDISQVPELMVREPGSKLLGFRGLEMDTVAAVVPLEQRAIFNMEANTVAASLLVEREAACEKLARSVYKSLELTPIQHIYTLIRGMSAHADIYDTSQATADYEIATKWYRALSDPAQLNVQLQGEELLSAQRYKSAMSVAWEGTCYFSTQYGRVHLGPAGMLPGDLVCIFFGAHVPHILRLNSGQDWHELIGPAFVCGLMSGTPFYARDPVRTYQTFTLG